MDVGRLVNEYMTDPIFGRCDFCTGIRSYLILRFMYINYVNCTYNIVIYLFQLIQHDCSIDDSWFLVVQDTFESTNVGRFDMLTNEEVGACR